MQLHSRVSIPALVPTSRIAMAVGGADKILCNLTMTLKDCVVVISVTLLRIFVLASCSSREEVRAPRVFGILSFEMMVSSSEVFE